MIINWQRTGTTYSNPMIIQWSFFLSAATVGPPELLRFILYINQYSRFGLER